uniref:Uncharacterized protein n=1 Tax=Caenorhabditis japonica TaxID=281687 RepID=A0A8R1I6U5_CAEJA
MGLFSEPAKKANDRKNQQKIQRKFGDCFD